MNILIIGASGLVGSNCQKLFSTSLSNKVFGTYYGFKLEGLYRFDSTKYVEFSSLPTVRWDLIIHTGALTNVDYCEENEEASYLQNFISTVNLVDFAKINSAKLVFISTDYVFDGEKGYYDENDLPNPINVYGNHKLQSERYIQENLSDFLIFRVTNVYGDEIRGKNFVSIVISQINQGVAKFRCPIDQFGTPINALDIAKVIAVSVQLQLKGIYNLASTDYMNRVQIVQKISDYFYLI